MCGTKSIAILAAAIFLSGCAQVKNTDNMARDTKACDAKYPLHVGNYYRHASCVDTAEFNYSAKSPSAFAQATDRATARDELAKQVDAGEISPEDAQNILSREFARAKGIAASKDAERRREAAMVMLQSGALQSHSYQAPIYPNMMGIHPLQTRTTLNCNSNTIGQNAYTQCH